MDLWSHKIEFEKIIAGWEGTVIIALSDFFAGVLDSPLKFMVTLVLHHNVAGACGSRTDWLCACSCILSTARVQLDLSNSIDEPRDWLIDCLCVLVLSRLQAVSHCRRRPAGRAAVVSGRWSGTTRQGRRSWGGCGVLPWKYVGRVRICFDPLKCHILSFKLLLYNCKFRSIKDEQLDTITSLILLMLIMLPSLCLISCKQTVSSNQCLCCYTGL